MEQFQGGEKLDKANKLKAASSEKKYKKKA